MFLLKPSFISSDLSVCHPDRLGSPFFLLSFQSMIELEMVGRTVILKRTMTLKHVYIWFVVFFVMTYFWEHMLQDVSATSRFSLFWNFSECRQQSVFQMFHQQRLTLDSQVLLVHTYIFSLWLCFSIFCLSIRALVRLLVSVFCMQLWFCVSGPEKK